MRKRALATASLLLSLSLVGLGVAQAADGADLDQSPRHLLAGSGLDASLSVDLAPSVVQLPGLGPDPLCHIDCLAPRGYLAVELGLVVVGKCTTVCWFDVWG
jgi:hypothetical protein